MGMSHWALLAGTLALAGCGGGREGGEQSRRDTGGLMGGTDSGGMGNMQGMAMMSGMQAHMDSMMRMSPQQMQAMMAKHQSMMSGMMDGMGSDMRSMKMADSPEWTALTDSVKRDLAELESLKGPKLSTRMRAHAARVKRLMGMHETMMSK